ncbi:MAG: NADH-quinone oxidoreductase subunit N [Alphaproteobacteria bacterium]|jgi:NADH-quinone oxidoreductase subunit N
MTEFNWIWYSAATPEMFIMVMCLFVLLVGAFSHKLHERRFVRNLTIISLIGTFLLVVSNIPTVRQFAFPVVDVVDGKVGALGSLYVIDTFTAFIKAFMIVCALLSLSLSNDYMMRKKTFKFEYDILILLSVLGAMIMVSAQDLLMMYIGLELMSFCLYILTAFHRKEVKSSEAGLKYFVLGSLASGLLLFGMSYIYGITGSTSFDGIQQAFANGAGISDAPIMTTFAVVLMIAGMAFKMSAAPFHMWTPDVYEGAPTPVTAYMAIVPKIAAIAIFIRVLTEPLMYVADQWQQIVIVLSILSMVVGSILAIVQTNLKRILAYSSIANVGFMLIPFATASLESIDEMLAYLVVYCFMTLGIFGILLSLRKRDKFVETIDDLKGLSTSSPILAACMLILMFSLAGVPPFAGFIVKLAAFKTAVDMGMAWLAVVGVICSVISAYYCLRIVKAMYFEESGEKYSPELPSELRMIVGLMVLSVIVFGLFPDSIIEVTQFAVLSLKAAVGFYG